MRTHEQLITVLKISSARLSYPSMYRALDDARAWLDEESNDFDPVIAECMELAEVAISAARKARS